MAGRVQKNDEQRPILLCCAGPDRAKVAPVVERASHLGRAWLVCGVEVNTQRLERGIERYANDALYVLCRSRHLDATQVRALDRLLRARGVPAAQIMVVELERGTSAIIETAIERRVRPGARQPTLVGAAIPPPPQVVRGGPRATMPLARITAGPKRSAPPPALDRVVRSPRPLASASTPAPEPVPQPAPELAAPAAVSARPKTDSVPLAPVAPALAPARSSAVMPRLPRKAPSRGLAASAVAVVLAIGGAVLAAASASDADAETSVVASAPAPEVFAAKSSVRVVASAAPVVAAPAPAPAELPESAPSASVAADSEPDLDRGEALERELEGLRRRELREVDGIVFAAQALPRDIHFVRAEAYCRNLSLSGIEQWRLPTAGELGTIAGAVELGREMLWTRTEGDPKGASMLTFDAQRQQFQIHERTWRGARALCVRSASDA